jgi:membrane-bound lytic murein transglycosylase B
MVAAMRARPAAAWPAWVVAPLLVAASACGPSDGSVDADRLERATPATSAPPTMATAPTTTAPAPTTTTLPAALEEALDDTPAAAGTPAELAVQLAAAEGAIRDPATAPDVLAAAGHLQQVVYRQLGGHPEWDTEVLARVPAGLADAVRLNAQSRREFRSMHRRLSDTLPAWRIVDPEPADVLLGYYQEAEATFGVGWEYLAAINLVETGMGRIRGTSVAGAQGPMQFMPATWAAYGQGDINSAHDAIQAAARYLSANGFTDPGGVDGALFRYNNHPAYVRGVAALARVMELEPRAFYGYYHWEIYYLSALGDVWLPVGYEATEPIPVAEYLADHPR